MTSFRLTPVRHGRAARALAMSALAATTLLMSASAAGAQTYTIKYDDEGSTSTMWVTPNAIRKAGGVYDVIDHADRGTLTSLDHRKKTYSETSIDVLKQQLSGAMNRDMSKMNPRDRERMHQMGLDAEPTLTHVGPGGTIAGYPTEHYQLKTPAMQTDVWITQALQMPAAYYRDFSVLDGTQSRFGDRGKIMELKGVILKRVVGMPGMPGGKTALLSETAVSVEKSPIPPSTFDVPAGYTKVERAAMR